MKLSIYVECPYCGFKNKFDTEVSWGYGVKPCDSDAGGCDGKFVVEYRAVLKTAVKKIEGEGKSPYNNREERNDD